MGSLSASCRRSAGWHVWPAPARIVLPMLVVVSMTSALGASARLQVGSSTGLPLPRYVSLKSDKVNLREGPSKDHRTTWVFERAGLPVEITAESDNWRRIRDSEGTEGWVLQSLLSGRRTALVAPWKKETLDLYAKPSETFRKSSPNSRPACSAMCANATADPGAASLATDSERLYSAIEPVGRLPQRENRIGFTASRATPAAGATTCLARDYFLGIFALDRVGCPPNARFTRSSG